MVHINFVPSSSYPLFVCSKARDEAFRTLMALPLPNLMDYNDAVKGSFLRQSIKQRYCVWYSVFFSCSVSVTAESLPVAFGYICEVIAFTFVSFICVLRNRLPWENTVAITFCQWTAHCFSSVLMKVLDLLPDSVHQVAGRLLVQFWVPDSPQQTGWPVLQWPHAVPSVSLHPGRLLQWRTGPP